MVANINTKEEADVIRTHKGQVYTLVGMAGKINNDRLGIVPNQS